MKLNQDFSTELKSLNQRFNTDFAIISHIVANTYRVCQIASELDVINIGDEFETSNTYCQAVIETNEIVTYDHVGNIDSMLLHPIYTAMQLESYIGYPLKHNGKMVGTLNFSSFEPKQPNFDEHDRQVIKELATKINLAISE